MGWIVLIGAFVPILLWGLAQRLLGWSEGDSLWILLVGGAVIAWAIVKLEQVQLRHRARAIYAKDLEAHAGPSSTE